ncbi:putative 28S rRNA (cytosine-C(5))-methyltransferase [Nowakowskiella sp. JEL0078]|nr:putative 28S rRNA (cytosine-C(5))-methyltransferase [Nowakowskiella sp. JEL0078]
MALLLACELLFGNPQLHGANPANKAAILNHKTRLKAELAKYKLKLKVLKNEDLIDTNVRDAIVLPRYVRVNTLKTTPSIVLKRFESEGYEILPPSENLLDIAYIFLFPHLVFFKLLVRPKTVRVDFHFPEIIVLPSTIDLHDHPLTTKGEIILQDKASCFPPYALNPPPNSVIIDACAAPGNKTSGLSALMNNTGKIFAFDRDPRRLGTLKKLCGRAGCENIEPVCVSFLDVDPLNPTYSSVEYILLDPSCSGSGITRRLDHLQAIAEDENHTIDDNTSATDDAASRLESLADFQLTALLHSFKFPKVKRVVYSTCSVNRQENEDVVAKALGAQNTFRLVDRPLDQWPRRGIAGSIEGAEMLVRTAPAEDMVIGFFVALFEKIGDETEVMIGGKNKKRKTK